MTHLPDAVAPVAGFVAAGISAGSLWLAQAMPGAPGWMEVGGTLGLIGGLSYGCVTLWKELQASRKTIEAINKEWRDAQHAQNQELINTLKKLDHRLDPDT